MKRLILVLVLFGSTSALADFQAGVDAYNRGDYAGAYDEWLPLAEQGHAGAQYNLGALYGDGHIDPPDDAAAARWFRLSAEQGNAPAQFALGKIYRRGQGVPQDDAKAVKWYRLAAEQRHAEAQAVLGAMYAQGYGVSQDLVQAYAWFQLADAQGYKPAQSLRGIIQRLMTPAQITEALKTSRELSRRLEQ